MLCEDVGQKWGQSLGARVWRRCSKEAHGADLEVVLLSWLGWGKVVDVDDWQLLRVLRPKRKESPMPASVLDLAIISCHFWLELTFCLKHLPVPGLEAHGFVRRFLG